MFDEYLCPNLKLATGLKLQRVRKCKIGLWVLVRSGCVKIPLPQTQDWNPWDIKWEARFDWIDNSFWRKIKLRTLVRVYKNSRNHSPVFQSGVKRWKERGPRRLIDFRTRNNISWLPPYYFVVVESFTKIARLRPLSRKINSAVA